MKEAFSTLFFFIGIFILFNGTEIVDKVLETVREINKMTLTEQAEEKPVQEKSNDEPEKDPEQEENDDTLEFDNEDEFNDDSWGF
jgi:Sec-independent protein translocase protein TatA